MAGHMHASACAAQCTYSSRYMLLTTSANERRVLLHLWQPPANLIQATQLQAAIAPHCVKDPNPVPANRPNRHPTAGNKPQVFHRNSYTASNQLPLTQQIPHVPFPYTPGTPFTPLQPPTAHPAVSETQQVPETSTQLHIPNVNTTPHAKRQPHHQLPTQQFIPPAPPL